MMSSLDPRLKFLLQEPSSDLQELAEDGRFAIEVNAQAAPRVRVLVDYEGDRSALENVGFTLTSEVGDIKTGEIELSRVEALANLDGVRQVETSRPLWNELDASVPMIGANHLHGQTPPNRGSGVIVGVIDSGIDYTHQIFRNAGGSRILRLWDQRLTATGSGASAERPPTGFTYGVEYTKTHIDNALANANPVSVVRHQDIPSPGVQCHGTHVAGIAAGDGSVAGNTKPANTFVGVAPAADIIFVASRNDPGAGVTQGTADSTSLLHAVQYIFQQAAAMNKPAAINISLGDNIGPHDGTSLLERGIDGLLGGPGRAVIKSAGNAANKRNHATGRVTSGATTQVGFQIPPGDSVADTIDIWYNGRDRLGFTITPPGGSASTTVNPGTTTTLNLPNGNRVFVDSSLNNPQNHDNRIQLVLRSGTAAAIQQGNWTFNLIGTTVVDGRFHAWADRGGRVPRFLAPHLSSTHTLTPPGTAREIISVASFITKNGAGTVVGAGGVAASSSRGPTRDGRHKPELAAPGSRIMSGRCSNMPSGASPPYQLMSGTSMAAPHVTGTAALLFEKKPQLTAAQIAEGLIATVTTDAATGTNLPDNAWGHGKLNAQAAAAYPYPALRDPNWARLRPTLANWPSGTTPPTFEIRAAMNGTAVIELAWDPQALLAPSASYPNPLRYYTTGHAFTHSIPDASGTNQAINVPQQTITLSGSRASWTMPQALWDAYRQEALKAARTPATSTFASNIYYRVRLNATGATAAVMWPPDSVVRNNANAPRMGMLGTAASPATQPVPDAAAVQAMGGIARTGLTNLFSQVLTWLWQNLPASDPNRQALAQVFSHAVYRQISSPQERAKVLKLWLFAGPSSQAKLGQLLDLQVRTSATQTQPAALRRDLRNHGNLIDNLLELRFITPHPDIAGVTVAEQLVDDVISEILDPNGQLNQGGMRSTGPTVFQTLLLHVNPAEYARLAISMLSATGRVQLANGTTVQVPPAIFQVARYAGAQANPFLVRTNSELAFQATMMKYALGTSFPTYSATAAPNAPNGINTVFQRLLRNGLSRDRMTRGLEGLFNVPFHHSRLGPSATIRDGFLTSLGNSHQPGVLVMWWDAPQGQPRSRGQAVLALRHDGGRIFFKNPQYAGSSPPTGAAAMASVDNPPRRYEDPSASLESIGDADLSGWILWHHTPDRAIG